jgi:AcrR family transcriptional regulator
MPTTQRRKRAIARTREDILEAAARAFTKRGFQSATMRDIAKEAGYTAASLYTYFKSKQAILAGLADLVTQEFVIGFDTALPAGLTFRQKLEFLTQRLMTNIERRRDLYALLMTLRPEHHCQPPYRDKHRQNPMWHLEMQVARLTEWLRANASPAELRGRDPEAVARFMIGVGQGFLSHWVFTAPPGASFSKNMPLLQDLMLHGISGNGASASNGGHDA